VVAPFAGRLADRLGARPLTVGGMSLVAIALFALSALRPTTAGFLVLLALVGIGLGCFTPPNNAAIMGSVPERQSGLASGVLNMTRGMGTALGLALTALVFDLAGGTSFSPNTVGHAFSLAAFFLGGAATVAVLLSAIGERGPLSRSVLARVVRPRGLEPKSLSRAWRSPLPVGRSARLARMFAIPSFDLVPPPHSADCQLCLRSRKITVRLDQLVHPLAGDAQNLGDLGHTHEMVGHHIQV